MNLTVLKPGILIKFNKPFTFYRKWDGSSNFERIKSGETALLLEYIDFKHINEDRYANVVILYKDQVYNTHIFERELENSSVEVIQ